MNPNADPDGAQPKFIIPSEEAPPSYSSLYLAASTNEPLLLPPTQPCAGTNGAPPAAVHAVAVGEPPSYDTLGLGGTDPLPHPPKWESVPLANVPASAPTRQYVVVVTSQARESLPKVCCCMPLKGGTIFLAVLKMVWIALTIFILSLFLSRIEDYSLYGAANDVIFKTCVARICLESILFLATLILIVCGIIKRRREFFTYYFILLGIVYSLNILATIYVAYALNSGITNRFGLLFIFDVYFCWKLIRYYNHLGRSVQVVAAH